MANLSSLHLYTASCFVKHMVPPVEGELFACIMTHLKNKQEKQIREFEDKQWNR